MQKRDLPTPTCRNITTERSRASRCQGGPFSSWCAAATAAASTTCVGVWPTTLPCYAAPRIYFVNAFVDCDIYASGLCAMVCVLCMPCAGAVRFPVRGRAEHHQGVRGRLLLADAQGIRCMLHKRPDVYLYIYICVIAKQCICMLHKCVYICARWPVQIRTQSAHRVRRPALYWHSIADRSESLHHRYLPLLEPFRWELTCYLTC
eukprot:COSAG06_NODE_10250_length_1719_cov_1.447531_2_plen_205_part_00